MIIAERELTAVTDAGEAPVIVRLRAPAREADGAWFCAFTIGWPERERRGAADGVQALLMALQMIGSEIYTSHWHAARRLRSERLGDGYGFPVPHGIRDVLEGDDAPFY